MKDLASWEGKDLAPKCMSFSSFSLHNVAVCFSSESLDLNMVPIYWLSEMLPLILSPIWHELLVVCVVCVILILVKISLFPVFGTKLWKKKWEGFSLDFHVSI